VHFGFYLRERVAMGPQTEAAPRIRVEYRMVAERMGPTELQHIVVVLAMALAVLDMRLAVLDMRLAVLDTRLAVLDKALAVRQP
jgi:hypothetical protein